MLSCSCFFSPSGVRQVHLELAVNFVQVDLELKSLPDIQRLVNLLVNESIHTSIYLFIFSLFVAVIIQKFPWKPLFSI